MNKAKNDTIDTFISYRRRGGREIARNIYERLSIMGINAFFDYNSMRNGRFNEQIYTAIQQAKDFILIYTPGALDNCKNEDDWVRTEIETALKYDKNIIIVFTEPDMEFPNDIPDSIKDIPNYHGMVLSQEYYDESIKKLLGMLTKRKKKWASVSASRIIMATVLSVIVCLIVGLLLFMDGDNDDGTSGKQKVTAEIYLPRYADINHEMLNNSFFTDSVLNIFEYTDTIASGEYRIFPSSPFLSSDSKSIVNVTSGEIIYHNLPLRIRLNNLKQQQVIFNKAWIEIETISPLPFELFSIKGEDEVISINNEGKKSSEFYYLDISELVPGESFLFYKDTLIIDKEELVYRMDENNGLHGRIRTEEYNWEFDYQPTFMKENRELNKEIKLSPLSSDHTIYNITIPSMKVDQEIPIPGFNRKLVKWELDDSIFIILKADFSFDAKLRIKFETTENKTIYTDFISIRYVVPRTFINYPF